MNLIKLPNHIEINKYRDYFFRLSNSLVSNQYYKVFNSKKTKNLIILELSSLFVNEFNFPPIEFFVLFRHVGAQSIHIDGPRSTHINDKLFRYASLNLPLSGYEKNIIRFFNQKDPMNCAEKTPYGYKFSKDTVNLIEEHEDTGEWVLLNSGIPHQIVTDRSAIRMSLCIRFEKNPTYEYLKELIIQSSANQ